MFQMQPEQTTAEELRQAFNRLTKQWRLETGGMSSVSQIIGNQNYLRIIALGRRVVPLILEDLKDRCRLWFPALQALSGRDDIGHYPGKFRLIADAWRKWGQEEGLL